MSPRLRDLSIAVVTALFAACTPGPEPAAAPEGSRTVAVGVGTEYTPSEIRATPGESLHLVFTRTTDEGCGQQLVFPTLHIRRDLPLNEPVAVDVTAPESGRVAFTCGMDMYRGAVVVQ
ncbi:MAG: cupredoxin domain-containing protein [Deltaproteobacteria bacterium]|nr:cupredoxin domain-containing protein [Deltaproteobacteria bacterium]